jgi:hypothetical protein
MQGNHQPDRQNRRQAAFADFTDPVLGNHLADGRLGNDLAEGVDGQGVNEFGAISIDTALIIGADEDIVEMKNGCMCCTVFSPVSASLRRIVCYVSR